MLAGVIGPPHNYLLLTINRTTQTTGEAKWRISDRLAFVVEIGSGYRYSFCPIRYKFGLIRLNLWELIVWAQNCFRCKQINKRHSTMRLLKLHQMGNLQFGS